MLEAPTVRKRARPSPQGTGRPATRIPLLREPGEARSRRNPFARQVMTAPGHHNPSGGEARHSIGMWDGYPAVRRCVPDAFASGRVRNQVVSAGDVRSSRTADVTAAGQTPVVGTDLVPGSRRTAAAETLARARTRELLSNAHPRCHEDRRDCVRRELTRRAAHGVSRPGSASRTPRPNARGVRGGGGDGRSGQRRLRNQGPTDVEAGPGLPAGALRSRTAPCLETTVGSRYVVELFFPQPKASS